jgi:hypothetical protein
MSMEGVNLYMVEGDMTSKVDILISAWVSDGKTGWGDTSTSTGWLIHLTGALTNAWSLCECNGHAKEQ